ncbi:MAG: ComEC/Rec2 family competence protein [Clostridia bacterium]|nr:ComEC/Rec2 family competence protein [Clostridia bacterium]
MMSVVFVCAVSYILGIVLSPLINLPYFTLFILCVLVAAIIGKLFMKYRIFLIAIAAVMMIFGSVRYNISSQNPLFSEFPEKFVEATGVVSSLPKNSESKYKYRYELDLSSISYLGNTYDTNAKILLNTEKELSFGDTVTAWGFLTDFSEGSNEFDFNYRRYYQSRGILSRLTALEINKDGTVSRFSPDYLTGKAKQYIYNNMENMLSKNDFAFASAVIFGDSSHFSKDYRSFLTKTGVLRILYSPFSHISVMLVFAAFLFSKRKRKNIFFIILLCLYLIFINNSPIALKAGLTAGLVLVMNKIKGYSDRLSIVSAVALLLTLLNPLLCFDGGFMMSIISSALLCVCYKPIYRFLSKSRILRKKRLSAPLTLWTVLSFGTLPFAAYYFNGISLYSIFLIPLILPFVAVLILLTPVMFIIPCLLTGFLMPVYSRIIAIIKIFPVLVSKLPFYYITLPRPSGIKIIIYCLLWWVLIRAVKSKFNTYQTKLILSAAAGLFICIALDFSINSLGIYFVNVDQGDAAVLHTSRGETVLIDGGGASDYEENYNIGESVFLPYLISHGFTHIDVAVVSHYHKDHIEGIITAAENLKINTLVMPDCSPENKFRKKLEGLAENKHIKIEYLGLGDKIQFRSGLTLSVIAPDNTLIDKENENDTSLVITADYGDFSALFTGDFEAEEDLLPPQNIDVLKVGHHGSKDANDFAFLDLVNPRIAVISVGKGNRYGLPNKEVIAKLENMGSVVLRTDRLGDIRLKVDKKGNIKYNSLIGGNQNAPKRR